MRALLDDTAGLHHQDAIAGQHRRQPMRDHQGRADPHQPLKRVLDQPLALGVERGGRFVEQKERRVAQDRTRDRDALALAARQRHAAFAHRGLEFLRQQVDEFERVRERGGTFDVNLTRVRAAKADVVGDRSREDDRYPAAPGRCAGAIPADRHRPAARRRTSPCRKSDHRIAGPGGKSCSCRRRTDQRSRSSRPAAPRNETRSSTGACGRAG